jgi:hypothetical protein
VFPEPRFPELPKESSMVVLVAALVTFVTLACVARFAIRRRSHG